MFAKKLIPCIYLHHEQAVCGFEDRDSVLSSDEYRQIERDFIHYLNGLNPEAENIPGENVSDIKMLTKLIYIMGDTTSNKGKER